MVNAETGKITDAPTAPTKGSNDKTGWNWGDENSCNKTEPLPTYLVLKTRDTNEKEI